jgi:hypothetical protein
MLAFQCILLQKDCHFSHLALEDGDMINALLLLFRPVPVWEEIKRAQRGFLHVCFAELLPVVILACFAEGYGLVAWGTRRGVSGSLKKFSVNEAVTFEIVQFVLSVLVVFICAWLLRSLGQTFHRRHKFGPSFSTMAYAMSSFFLARLLSACGPITPWLPFAIGIILCLRQLYHGIPRVMDPDPPQTFGLLIGSSVFLIMISGMARFVTAWFCAGKFLALEATFKEFASHLPF